MLNKNFLNEMVLQKLITDQQLELILEEQALSKKSFYHIILKNNFLDHQQIIKFFAKQHNLMFFDKIQEQMVDPLIISKISFKFLRQNNIIPIISKSTYFILTSQLENFHLLDQVASLIPHPTIYGLAPKEVINEAINRYYPFDVAQEAINELEEEEEEFDLANINQQDLLDVTDDAPVVKLVNHSIFQAIKEGASDIHIEPFEKELRIRYRIDGVMHHKLNPPKRYLGAIISRIKIMANLNIAEKKIPQDGRIQIKVAEKPIDLRISVLPCNFGERVVMRILDKSKGVTELESLNLSKKDYEIIKDTIQRPNGIILVSGPTGSGKTTTLYSVLSRLNDEESNIITVEDPVEYTMAGVNQVQVNVKTGLTFSSALRSILRQDPDTVLIGEIRDGETATIATQAALTGHLVLSTIHTNSAPATITRLIDMDIEPFLVASSLICVIAQRLVRSLCHECKQQIEPSQDILQKFGETDYDKSKMTFYKAVGCHDCFETGYKGRLPLFEVMQINDDISTLIVQKANVMDIKKVALQKGMTTLSMDGFNKASQGLTTLEEVLTVAFADN